MFRKHRTQSHLSKYLSIALLFLITASYFNQTLAADALRGELEVIQIDGFDFAPSELRYYLRQNARQKPIPLNIKQLAPELRSGMKVMVRGYMRNGELDVAELNIEDQASTDSFIDSTVAVERRAAVFLVDLNDAKVSTQLTTEQVANTLYYNTVSVNNLFKISTSDQLFFNPDSDGDMQADVFGPVQINLNAADSCDYYSWAYAVENQISGQIDLSLYQHRVFVLPRHNSLPHCNWGGVANLGCGSFCRAWIAEGESGMVYAHELGHNLGMHHAGTDTNNDSVLDSEYGDHSGIMGSNRAWNQSNAPHTHQLGGFDQYPHGLLEPTAPGTYDLDPLDVPQHWGGIGAQVIKLPKSDTNDFYYFSFRKSVGDFPVTSTYADRVSVHRYRGSGSAKTSLVALLSAGHSFTDAANGINVRVASIGDTAQLELSFSCAVKTPTVSLSPNGYTATPGEQISGTIDITNMDGNGCGNTTFYLSSAAPEGVSADSADSVALAAGDSASLSWPIQVSDLAADGSYNLSVTLTDPVNGHASVTKTIALSVDATAPSAPTNLVATLGRKKTVKLTWDAASDSNGIARYEIFRNGEFLDSTSHTDYSYRGASDGSYTFHLIAVDHAGLQSPPSDSFTLVIGGGSGDDTTKGGGKGNGKGGGKK